MSALLLVVERAPLALVTAGVLLAAGLGWGWQTMRDRTVVWAMAQHTSFLMPMTLLGLA